MKNVFIIGFYFGIQKPKCSNEFIRPVVDEIIHLQKKGITVKHKTYQFRLEKLVMDAPARSYILGVKNHRSKKPCQRCHVSGTKVYRGGFASTNVQRASTVRANAYLDLDAARRTVEEMRAVNYAHSSVPECDPGCTSGGCWDDEEENIAGCEDMNFSDDEENDAEMIFADKQYIKHRTLLLKIPNFDVVHCVVLDYLHLVCLGVMDKLLEIWKREKDILSDEQMKRVDELLTAAQDYFPVEFQRRPETLENLSYWKGTQYRDFLLYTGIAVLRGSMYNCFLQNFIYLVVAIRVMVRKVPHGKKGYQKIIANNARQCLLQFVKQSIELYGPEFVIYNVHSLIHLPDDYELFGPLDTSSAYMFESFNGKIKKYVNGGSADPLQQIVNVYSDRLGLGEFCNEREHWDEVEEFFEQPQAFDRRRSFFNFEDIDDEHYDQYLQLKFQNFVLRSDNDRDNSCTISTPTGVRFVKVENILKKRDTDEYFIIGKFYEEVRSMFDTPCSSLEVGMALCSKPTTQSHMFPISQLQNKCFAFPTVKKGLHDTEWAFSEFLH